MSKETEFCLHGKFIGVQEDVNTFCVQKSVHLNQFKSAVLTITALGLYVVHINGVRVGNIYLAPGFTPYRKLLQVQQYDVTSYLNSGENKIMITVNEGWYCGKFGLESKKNNFGDG